jgi:hypothetical protein
VSNTPKVDPDRNPTALRTLGLAYTVLGFTYMGLVFVLNGGGSLPIPQDGGARWLTYLILGAPALMFFQTGASLRRRSEGTRLRIPVLAAPFLLAIIAVWFAMANGGR